MAVITSKGEQIKKASSEKAEKTPLILIADDSPTVLDILKFILETNGMKTITAVNGFEAVQKVYQEIPDLIVLDIEMPKMSGYQVCRLLKSDPQTSGIPIIILTSKTYKQNKFWGLYSGADDYLTKDFEIENLVKRVKFHYSNREALGSIKKMKPRSVREDEILESVNEALDRKLFETTIVYEISQVALSSESLEEKVSKVLMLMNRVCDFAVSSIFLVDTGTGKLFIENPGMASESYIFNHVEQVMMESQNYDIKFDSQKILVNQWEVGNSKGKAYDFIQSKISFPLKVRGVTQGIISLSHYNDNVFPEIVSKLLERSSHQISILIDEAVLLNEFRKLRTDLLSHVQNTFKDIMKTTKETEAMLGSGLSLYSPLV